MNFQEISENLQEKMTALTSDLLDNTLKIGDVFTPIEWGRFAIREFDLFEPWLNGKTVFDPTMGEGSLLESFVAEGFERGYEINYLPIYNLYGCEKNKEYHQSAIQKFKNCYGIDLSDNFALSDLMLYEDRRYDIILGNPPWQNFVDLPENYKEELKDYYHRYGLINNAQSLLLGGARIDIAALVINKSVLDCLEEGGDAVFFTPLSIFLNDGANEEFRTYSISGVDYQIKKIIDFNKSEIFQNVSTRYGLFGLRRNKKTVFPIRYSVLEDENWKDYFSKPLLGPKSPLSILSDSKGFQNQIRKISAAKESSPRQGINTCGANDVFFFSSYTKVDESTCIVNDEYKLPEKYVYPLITKENFKDGDFKPVKWVLLPYNRNGKPLSENEICQVPDLFDYLSRFKKKLSNRKGAMINSSIRKGIWWALLGVGPYNFFSVKIVWQAYGKQRFHPVIFSGEWQANQSLQAFIPCRSQEQAAAIHSELSEKWVEDYLLSLRMEGTMNWAQPGKIKKLLTLHETQTELF